MQRSISNHSQQEELEDTKGVIRVRISKNRQHNNQQKMYKRTNSDLQNIDIKLKDWVTRTPLKTGGDLRFSGTESTFCYTSGTCRVKLVTEPVISHE